MTKGRIDSEELKSRINLEDLIGNCGVELKKVGREYVGLCPFHNEKTPSFKVTPSKQLYHCAGCNKGGDHIKFLQDHYGLDFRDAAAKLDEMVGGALGGTGNAPRESTRAEPVPEWTKMPTAPRTAPDCPKKIPVMRNGKWVDTPVVSAWAYRTLDGELIGYTCRIEYAKDDGKIGKDVIPLTWQQNIATGQTKWRQGSFDKPRPLYGQEVLALFPDANIILVEGEKARDAGVKLTEGMGVIVMTWPGGCKAVEFADWSVLAGRKIVAFPDVDSQTDKQTGEFLPWIEQPGLVAMMKIADLVPKDAAFRIVEPDQPGVVEDGWDLFDAAAQGWTQADLLAEIRDRLRTPAEIIAISELPRHADEAEPEGEPEHDHQSAIDEANAEIYASKANESAENHENMHETGENQQQEAETPADPVTPDEAKTKAKKEKAKRPPGYDEIDNLPVRALGYNHGRYYYLSHRQRQVHEYQKHDHNQNGMLQLAPLDMWSGTFAYGGEMKGQHWQAATDALMRLSERQGIFDPVIVRGRGCWMDDKRLAINLGNRVIVDGKEHRGGNVEGSNFIYEAGARLLGPSSASMPVSEARRVLDISKRLNWEMPGSAALLAGWIVMAPLCGSLPWRPHIWLTGGTGTGKTTIMEKFISPMMTGMGLHVQGNSTEAGIRQVLRADALPVIFDESEQNNDGDERRIQNVLALARQSSSESQSRTLKGTTSGKHLEFHIRSMFCLASIQVGIQRQADQTRISVLSLYSTGQIAPENLEAHQQKWLETEIMLADLVNDSDYAGRFLARSIKMYDVIRQNMKVMIRAAAIELKSQRLGDQYGTLLAGAATLMYDHPISAQGATKFIQLFDWSRHIETAREDESRDALMAIMQVEVRVEFERGSEMRSVGQLIAIVVDNQRKDGVSPLEAATVLGNIGVRIKRGLLGNDAGVLFANKNDKLQKSLRGAPWAADWKSYLRRLPGAHAHSVPIRFAEGVVCRCTYVPVDVVLPPDTPD